MDVFAAIALRKPEIALSLLRSGAAVNQRDQLGRTPLTYAQLPDTKNS